MAPLLNEYVNVFEMIERFPFHRALTSLSDVNQITKTPHNFKIIAALKEYTQSENIHNSSQLSEHIVKSSGTHLNFKWWEFFVVLPLN